MYVCMSVCMYVRTYGMDACTRIHPHIAHSPIDIMKDNEKNWVHPSRLYPFAQLTSDEVNSQEMYGHVIPTMLGGSNFLIASLLAAIEPLKIPYPIS